MTELEIRNLKDKTDFILLFVMCATFAFTLAILFISLSLWIKGGLNVFYIKYRYFVLISPITFILSIITAYLPFPLKDK